MYVQHTTFSLRLTAMKSNIYRESAFLSDEVIFGYLHNTSSAHVSYIVLALYASQEYTDCRTKIVLSTCYGIIIQ